jgi:translation initiation factor 2 subunit 2
MSENKEEIKKMLFDYESLLQRLYKKVPVPASSGERFEPPKAIVMNMGSQTIIRNFREIADKMRREPQLLQRYLLKELATSGTYDESSGALILNIRITASSINKLIDRFVKTYVICPTCGRPDTRIIKKGKIWILKCEACGAEQPIKPF